jgi:putative N6-adenine-specific DNA methylase
MFDYQRHARYFAQANPGLVDLAEAELRELGARQTRALGSGVDFEADPSGLYRINHQARLVSRVLAPLARFECPGPDDLYAHCRALPWETLFNLQQTFAVFANVRPDDAFRHSGFAALRLKDAVADRFRDRFGRRPDVDPRRPDLWFGLHVEDKQATVSLDTSGGPLHRRGYRGMPAEAPIQETLAAAMVRLSGWQGERRLIDPLCGSGTLVCEALMAACRIPAAYRRRRFGFAFLPDYDNRLWSEVRRQAEARIGPLPRNRILAADLDPRAVAAARGNLARLPNGADVPVRRRDLFDWPELADCVILCNPPYGIRLARQADLGDWYRRLGDFLKRRAKGSTALIYFGDRSFIKHIGLRPSWKRPLPSGGLDGRLARYDLY